jgi:hypothetical protein
MNNPTDETIKKDVLQTHEHSQLSSEEIAKAIARHKREHSEMAAPEKPQKKSGKR